MKNKFQALRKAVLAALALVLAFSAAVAVVPAQAATASTKSDTFGFRFIYKQDGKTPSAANAEPVNVVILRDGKAFASFNNLKYGDRFTKTLPRGMYQVDIYFFKTGKLFRSVKLSNRTNQKDSGLSVVVRLPGTNPPPYPRVVNWVNGVMVK